MEAGLRLVSSGVEAAHPVGDRAYSSEGLRDRGIGAGGGRAGRRAENENDYENDERVRSRAEEWPTEHTETGTRGGNGGNGKGGGIFLPRNTRNTRKAEESPTEHTEKGTRGRNRREVARGACKAYAGFSRSGRGAIRRNRESLECDGIGAK